MQITLEVPQDVADGLQAKQGDLSRAALESLDWETENRERVPV